eukprot:comp18018_c0_seq1/m.18505 comp18018_c0_seq1/g.18505  ORF comp18018_c0_seq1/g.18505 comp18018_c0_seq1/m.18505 type:complete len:335 (-) comp18018_c0_seq1:159-1163(-)
MAQVRMLSGPADVPPGPLGNLPNAQPDNTTTDTNVLMSAHRKLKQLMGGLSVEEAIKTALILNGQNSDVLLNLGGEHYTNSSRAQVATWEYLQLLDLMARAGVEGGISVKPTQLGLMVDVCLFRKNLYKIVSAANAMGYHVEVDTEMEETRLVTIEVFKEILRDMGHKAEDRIGAGLAVHGTPLRIAMQCEYRDALQLTKEIISLGGSVRAVKGRAYNERVSPHKYTTPDEIQASFTSVVVAAAEAGMFPAVATGDKSLFRSLEVQGLNFELQFLYGLPAHVELAEIARREGETVCFYVTFGEWRKVRGYVTRRKVLTEEEVGALDALYGTDDE